MSPRSGAAAGAPPRPAGAAARAPWLVQARFELAAILRNGEQLLLNLVLPALLLVGLVRSDLVALETAGASRAAVVTPGVLTLGVVSAAFTSQAISTAFDRRAGVLRLLATTPLGPGGLLAGKVTAVLAVQGLQLLLLGAVGAALGWRPAAGTGVAVAAMILGTAAFGGLALLLAGTLRFEAVLALANLIWVLLMVGGGVLIPPGQLPAGLAALAPYLPSGALGEALRIGLSGVGATAELPRHLGVLAAWAALLPWAARRLFRWS